MEKLIKFFYPKEKPDYFNELKINFYIIQVFIIVPILIFFSTHDFFYPDKNFYFSFYTKVIITLYLLFSLFILKFKGIKLTGNIFAVVIMLVTIIPMNIFPENTSMMFKYVYGFYSVFAAYAYGILFANRKILLMNSFIIFLTTTHIYLHATSSVSENNVYFKAGYMNHTLVLLSLTMLLFFIHKFTELSVRKANSETEIQIRLNRELDEKVIRRTRELTEAKKNAEKNEEKFKQINNTKDKFFSIIAHDLRNPFNSLLGFSRILSKDFDGYNSNEQKEFIAVIHRGIESTHKLLENLLLWSKSQSGKIRFLPDKINLHLMANETVYLLSQSIDKKTINIQNNIEKKIYIYADERMLLTIFRNLISNAIKFSNSNGKIIISARQISNKQNQNCIEISIKDNGIGIAKHLQSKLFIIGENTSTPGTEKEPGSGLGLILCKEFIDKHDGQIWVRSEKDKGSEFIFTLKEA